MGVWFNPRLTGHGDWLPDESVCYEAVEHVTLDPSNPQPKSGQCHLITVESPVAVSSPTPTPAAAPPHASDAVPRPNRVYGPEP